jgi:hypothetical protein
MENLTRTDITLQKRERANVLIATLTTDPEKVERGLTIKKIIDHGTPLSVLGRVAEKKVVKQLLDVHLIKLAASFNMNLTLKDYQIGQIIEDLIERYPNETIEDFIYIFKQARQGAYGEVYRLDSAVIFGWVEKHLEQKYDSLEAKLMREKDTPYQVEVSKDALPIEDAMKYLDEMAKAVQGGSIKEAPRMTKAQILEEGGLIPKKKGTSYQPNDEYAILRLKEIEWMKVMFHPLTKERVENFLSFEEWLRQ